MVGRLEFREVELRKGDSLSWAVARLIVSELIDHNADTVERSTAAYLEKHPLTERRHFVLLCDDMLAGAGSIRPDSMRANTQSVDGLVVSEAHRGNDFGRLILGLVAQQARTDGAETLSLGTWIPSYFERYGFQGDRREMTAPIDSVIALANITEEEAAILA